MRRSPLLLIVLASTLLAACGRAIPGGVATTRATGASQAQSVPGRLIVRWKTPGAAAAILKQLGVLKRGEALGPEGLAPEAGAAEVVDLPAGVDETKFMAAAGSALDWVEHDRILRIAPAAAEAEAPELPGFGVEAKARDKAPGDPQRGKQWALSKVNIEGAWRVTRGNPGVLIAIVDSGADLGHPDLKGQIADSWRASGLLGRMGLASANDDFGHGTHCAGIAAAAADNNEGVAGAAPGCKLLIVKALDKTGAGATSDIVRGIRWAMSHGAKVISLSVGGEDDSRALRDACTDALQAGIVVVAAMGNDGKTIKNWPAAIPGVIAVGATTKSDGVAGFSTRGSWISIAAPGASILSTAPTYAATMNSGKDAELQRGYGVLSGTSMATPLVAGIAALMLSARPGMKPAQIKAALEKSAVGSGGTNIRTGHGRVDAAKALAAAARE